MIKNLSELPTERLKSLYTFLKGDKFARTYAAFSNTTPAEMQELSEKLTAVRDEINKRKILEK